MKNILSLIAILILSTAMISAQPKRPGARPAAQLVEKVIPVDIIDEANGFADKGLPVAKVIGGKVDDATAARLAKELATFEDGSLATFTGALQKAGYYIQDEKQKILYKPTAGKGMGLAFYDFEVAGMYKLARGGAGTTMTKLALAIGKDLPPAEAQKLAANMLADLRAAANSKDEARRFWARFIIEIGLNFPEPVDLMKVSPENATLDPVQAALIERRLTGDLISLVEKSGGGMAYFKMRDEGGLFGVRCSETLGGAFFQKVSLTNGAKDPCNFTAVETTQVDVAATAMTTIHGKTLETVAEHGQLDWLGKLGKGIGYVNLALSWAKLVAAVSQMKGSIKVEDPLPLIRTQNTKAGEKRLLTGKFEIKINDLRKLNCYRLAINMTTGLDFSMPSSGPLAEKPVSWELGGEVSFKGQNSSKTGAYKQVVYFNPVSGANRDHHKQETDANGESKIYLEGAPQKEDMTNEKLVPLPKIATVRADVALKNMKDSKQEAADVGAMAFGVATGGGALGILSSLPELGFRAKIPVAQAKVPVRDWIPCSEDWGGTFSYTHERSQKTVYKGSRTSNGNSTGDGDSFYSFKEEANIELRPRTQKEIDARVSPKPAVITVKGEWKNIIKAQRKADPCCGKEEGKFDTLYTQGYEENVFEVAEKIVAVGSTGGERDYSLMLVFGIDYLKTERREFLEVHETTCQLEKESSWSVEKEGSRNMGGSLPFGRYGERFVNSEGEILRGTKIVNESDGSVTTWSWALARCKGGS